MAVFIILWPSLLTTKLSCLQRNNFGHTNLKGQYKHCSPPGFEWALIKCLIRPCLFIKISPHSVQVNSILESLFCFPFYVSKNLNKNYTFYVKSSLPWFWESWQDFKFLPRVILVPPLKKMKIKSCLNDLKFVEVSRNTKSNIC